MLYLQCKKRWLKTFVIGLAIFVSTDAQAQRNLNLEEHDQKPYYFGISLGFNRSGFHSERHPNFLLQDTILAVEPLQSTGFNLGLSATVRLNHRFELRANPQLIFLDRTFQYNLKYPDKFDNALVVQKKVESVIVNAPLQLRFLSDRIGNFRVYMMGGGKLELDLASNAQSRNAENMIRIKRYDYGVEGGIGFKFYYPSFILSPEIKFSNGLRNMHFRNPKLNYSDVLDRVNSRMIVFTLHLEG
ncbi:outer membrane beta-barrel protein [Flavisolibacter sp. BT320]|nr:outer membrane beta-barrel protein [Flavisolibacter longurius]